MSTTKMTKSLVSPCDLLTAEQQNIFDKYCFTNYVSQLKSITQLLSRHEIMKIEKATRGQSTNPLWFLLRLDRQTASGSNTNSSSGIGLRPIPALTYGLEQETCVKNNESLLNLIRECVERETNKKITETVLDCGMFFSKYGLHSASPDAYFILDDDTIVPMEIKCPHTYRDTTVDEVRRAMNARKERYRIKHTAFSVNRNGPARFVVEKTDPHYRQMQRQLHVLDSSLVIYLVRFKDSFVASIVKRDDEFCDKESKTEQTMFKMFVNKNTSAERFRQCAVRIKSFANTTLTNDNVEKLAKAGFYYSYGNIACAYCDTAFDEDESVDTILDKHKICKSNKTSFVKNDDDDDDDRIDRGIRCVHKEFLTHSMRLKSLVARGADSRFAKWGLFYDTNTKRYKTFCCDLSIDNFNITHTDNCEYRAVLMQQQ
ncbi:ALK-EXO [Helicoverpa armigera SNPV]|nr:ALK-EXO [Helicoverpa armigera SNPV]